MFAHRHLLGIEGLSPQDITTLLDLAEEHATATRDLGPVTSRP